MSVSKIFEMHCSKLQVPAIWANRAYPSLLGLSAWFVDLLLRLRELETWATDFVVSEFYNLKTTMQFFYVSIFLYNILFDPLSIVIVIKR